MARTPDLEMKRELLDRVVGYLAVHGLGDVSLRPMAAALNTSPNRLVHHFGSKQALLAAALHQATLVQVQVRDAWLKRTPELSKTTELRKWWKWLNDSPANLALTRLGLEAVTLEATHTGLSGDVRAEQIGVWREQIEQKLVSEGVPKSVAVTEASLLKGVFTGLIMDLLATGDKQRLSKALEVALQRTEAVLDASRQATSA